MQGDRMKTEIIECEEGKFSVISNDAIADRIKSSGWWEKHFSAVCLLIREGAVAIDGGANFGYNAVVMAKRVGVSGKVLCFEPQPIMYDRLKENFPLNGLTNGDLRMQALWDNNCMLKIPSLTGHGEGLVNYGGVRVGRGVSCEAVTIDSLRIHRLDFLKLDLEGEEARAIRGGMGTIRRFMPVMHIEYDRNLQGSSTEALELCKALGYRVYHISTDYPSDHLCMPPGDERHEQLGLVLTPV